MANHKQAAKRARQTIVRTQRNKFYKTRIKNITKAVLSAVEAGNKEEAVKTMAEANKYFHHCISRKILKKENASRKVSRLQIRVNAV